MKKIIGLLLVIAMVLMVTACNDAKTEPDTTAGAPQTSEVSEDQKTTAATDKNLSAAFVTAQPLGDPTSDMGYNDGFVKAAEDFGFERTTVVEVKKGEYEENFRALAEDGYGLIIAWMPELQEAVGKVAPDYPDTKFFVCLGNAPGENVSGSWTYHEGAYVAGAYAALMTKTNKIAFLGGVDNDQVNNVAYGFKEGAEAVNPNVQVQLMYVGSFIDPTKGKELSLVLYNSGVDIIMHSCAQSGLGMFEACKQKGQGYYCIGADTNQNNVDVSPGNVIGSFMTPLNVWVYDAMKTYAEGAFEKGVRIYGVEEGVNILMNTEGFDIPQAVQDKVKELTEKVISGEIKPLGGKPKGGF